jgi:hypothetical protein
MEMGESPRFEKVLEDFLFKKNRLGNRIEIDGEICLLFSHRRGRE